MAAFRHRRLRWIASWLLLAAAYFVTGKLGLRLAFMHPSATPVWAPSGISLAALLLLGVGAWPAIFAGAFFVNITTAGSVATCFGIATGNTLEAIAGMWLINRFANGREAFQVPRDVFRFAALGGGLSTVLAATFGTTSLIMTGYAARADFGPIWLTWWLGDAMGDLLIAPLLVLWAVDWRFHWPARRVAEAAVMLASLVAVGQVVFCGVFPIGEANYPIEFFCLPILLWPAFRFGVREAVSAAAVLACLAIFGTARGSGPFVGGSPNTSLLLLQAYVGVITVMSMAVAATVWERKRVEFQLRESERHLLRHSADLEQFAYAASHDLREPLRTVSLFAQLLAERYAEPLGKEAHEFIDRIVGGASRMEVLITGLLNYSLLSHSKTQQGSKVRMDEVVDSVQKNLESLIRENDARIIHAELPVLNANREQLISLFQNLVSNAIKYRTATAPVINISAKRNENGWRFSVRDNGIGIDPQHGEQIFGLFTRLHGDTISGCGIGLAIARRIVELHDGRIWVESEKGKGATFYFTIPMKN